MNTQQVTVRNVDIKLKKAIQDKARTSKQSINSWMLDAAREKAGVKRPSLQSTWKNFAGSINLTDQELKDQFSDFRKVDLRDWQ